MEPVESAAEALGAHEQRLASGDKGWYEVSAKVYATYAEVCTPVPGADRVCDLVVREIAGR